MLLLPLSANGLWESVDLFQFSVSGQNPLFAAFNFCAELSNLLSALWRQLWQEQHAVREGLLEAILEH